MFVRGKKFAFIHAVKNFVSGFFVSSSPSFVKSADETLSERSRTPNTYVKKNPQLSI